MILLLLNFILAFAGGAYLLGDGRQAPLVVAIPCLLLGGIVVSSRLLAWASGAAQAGYTMADSQPIESRTGVKNRMVIMELLYWGLGLFNIWVFVGRFI